mmetsp:Transcript_3281/g.6140  ORF Transcript_3281/g.6140 Transcript_3281/m.6140 type:complete len:250 (+) Transcript_3281:239-988(+)
MASSRPSFFQMYLSPLFSTTVHPLHTRHNASGIGVGSYKYNSQFWEILLDGIRRCLCLIMRNRGIVMMCNMCTPNLMMKEINQSIGIKFVIRPINGMQRPFDKIMILICKMWHGIRMLKPRIQHQPSIDHQQWSTIQCHHLPNTMTSRPCRKSPHDCCNPNITLVDFLLPITRKQLLLGILRFRQWIGIEMIRQASCRTSRGTNQEISRLSWCVLWLILLILPPFSMSNHHACFIYVCFICFLTKVIKQ